MEYLWRFVHYTVDRVLWIFLTFSNSFFHFKSWIIHVLVCITFRVINQFIVHVLPDKQMRGCGRSRRTSPVLYQSTMMTCESFQTLTSPPAHRSPSATLEEATVFPTGALTPASAVAMGTHPALTRTIILLFPTRAKPWRSWNGVLLLTKLCLWKSDW